MRYIVWLRHLEINRSNKSMILCLSRIHQNFMTKKGAFVIFQNVLTKLINERQLKTEFDNNIYTFEFDHNNLPENIEKLLSQLEKYFK